MYDDFGNQVGTQSDGGMFSSEIYQGDNQLCAVHAQYHVLKEYGFQGSVDDLIKESEENNWSDASIGTPIDNIGNLLESHGVSCTHVEGANEYRLFAELAQGKNIVVAVDSGELWHGETDDADQEMDHALTVCGMDTSDPDNIQVIVTDSGAGHAAKAYPLETFMDAWRDSNCSMWVPDFPPPEDLNVERLANFDYDQGHMEQFGDLSFDELLELQSCDEDLPIGAAEDIFDEFDGLEEEPDVNEDMENTEEDMGGETADLEVNSEIEDEDSFADLGSIDGFDDIDQNDILSANIGSDTDNLELEAEDPFADLGSIDGFDDIEQNNASFANVGSDTDNLELEAEDPFASFELTNDFEIDDNIEDSSFENATDDEPDYEFNEYVVAENEETTEEVNEFSDEL